jgi:hypothetical protein
MRVDFEKSVVRSKTAQGEVNAERLDHHVYVPECVPDCVGIERVACYLIEVCIFDWYARGRTRQGPNAVAGAKCGPRRFKSDPVARTYDENIGHISPNSYLFSARCWQAGQWSAS